MSQRPGVAGRLATTLYGWPAASQIQRPDEPADELLGGHVDEHGARRRRRSRAASARVERLGLGTRPREAVEDRPGGRVGPAEAVEEQADRDLVGHELAALHVALRLEAERRARSRPRRGTGRRSRRGEQSPQLGSARSGGLGPLARRPGAPSEDAADRHHTDEALVVAHQELGLDLLHRLDDDRHDDEQAVPPRLSAPRLGSSADDDVRRHGDQAQEEGAGERDPGDDPGQVVLGRPAGPDARDEPAVLAQLLGRLVGLEREGRVEVGEADGQQEVEQPVDAACC